MSIDPKADYYCAGGIEVIEIIRAKLTHEMFKGYLLGNAMKYLTRLCWKHQDGGLRDCQKAQVYLKLLAEAIEGEGA